MSKCRKYPLMYSRAMHRTGIILSLAFIGLIVRMVFFSDLFTRAGHVQSFFLSLIVISFIWHGLEKINSFLNRKVPYSKGIMRRIVVQFVIGQIFFYGFLVVLGLFIVPIFKEIPLTREVIFSGLVVYLLINIAANSAIVGFHFFNEWKKSLLQQSMLEKEKSQANFENLKNQLNPHFLFNSLSSLNSLIFENPELASKFLKQLSKVYRYLLENNQTEYVPLETEIDFVEHYISLLQTRFGNGLEVKMQYPEPDEAHYRIIPVTLQILVENAIKHNITYEDSPLKIEIYTQNGYLVVQNNHQPKTRVEGSNKKGLDNLRDLYYYTTGREAIIESSPQVFTVKIPLIAA
ncbi:MAG: histidine kinase [Bacteroidetes bacterium]|nr:MAG: histidine kinase [Bacteroidota bacterium]